MTISGLFANATTGGMEMNANQLWQVFLDTGAPEIYLLYNQLRRMEERDVSNDPGVGYSGIGLQ